MAVRDLKTEVTDLLDKIRAEAALPPEM